MKKERNLVMRRSFSIIAGLLALFTVLAGACASAATVPVSTPASSVAAPPAAVVPGENTTLLFTTERIQVPVWLSPGGRADYTVAAWLTRPKDGKDLIFVTVPGSTYGHIYWDFPYKPETYSFVQAMAKAGYSSLNIDRMGSGESSKPSMDITGEVQARVIHQLIDGLRSGSIGGHPYRKIILVGHSLGSCVLIQEAASYGDADGLIITGLLHYQSFPGSGTTGLMNLSAAMQNSDGSDDPIFKGIPTPSYTTRPGMRGTIFYNIDQADPEVLKTDEQTKVTTPTAENSAFRSVGRTDEIHSPVLLVVGEMDRLFSGSSESLTLDKVSVGEKKYFQPSTQLDFFVLPLSGHDINLQYNAPLWYEAAKSWVSAKMQ
jgi:pimeloyl-ACP methyl ester carboxylesterase